MCRIGFTVALLLSLGLPALAHQPWCEFADLTSERPWQVPDAAISYAYFGNMYPAGDVDYFQFDAEAGQRVLLSLSIPAIPDLEVFSPLMALVGPGVSGDLAAAPLEAKDGEGVMPIPVGEAPVYWFEPFGRRYYWNWDDYFFRAPQTASYTVALWHPQDAIGRYSFVIGTREVFGGQADCFASYGEYWTPLQPGVNPYRDMPMDHGGLYEMDAADAPTLHLRLIRLKTGGVIIRAITENFVFTPDNIDKPPVAGAGHGHLYIDGEKIGRVLGKWHLVDSLPQDAETLSVTLYSNDHRAYAVDGIPISDLIRLAD